jgi:hypothetical protein
LDAVVRPTDPTLFSCPFVIMSDAGTVGFSDTEVQRMREYLLKGGFLWADDFWGDRAWVQFASEIGRVLPGYAIVEMTPEHPLFQAYYTVKRVPQVPSIQHALAFRGTNRTWEREDAKEVDYRAIKDDKGRIMVMICHNTDTGDGWEREGEDEYYVREFSEKKAYPLGINIIYWAMTH